MKTMYKGEGTKRKSTAHFSGASVFYKGLVPSLIKSAIQAALIFTLVEVVHDNLKKYIVNNEK